VRALSQELGNALIKMIRAAISSRTTKERMRSPVVAEVREVDSKLVANHAATNAAAISTVIVNDKAYAVAIRTLIGGVVWRRVEKYRELVRLKFHAPEGGMWSAIQSLPAAAEFL
jgi:hypothetical protein